MIDSNNMSQDKIIKAEIAELKSTIKSHHHNCIYCISDVPEIPRYMIAIPSCRRIKFDFIETIIDSLSDEFTNLNEYKEFLRSYMEFLTAIKKEEDYREKFLYSDTEILEFLSDYLRDYQVKNLMDKTK